MEALVKFTKYYTETLGDLIVYSTVAGFAGGLVCRGVQNISPKSNLIQMIGNPPTTPAFGLPVLGALTGLIVGATWPVSVPVILVDSCTLLFAK